MPSWKWRTVKQSLNNKGFVVFAQTTHEMYRLEVDGKKTSVRTMISHGYKGELNSRSPLFTSFQKQLHLQNKQLADLLNCPLTLEEYVDILQAQGKLKFDD